MSDPLSSLRAVLQWQHDLARKGASAQHEWWTHFDRTIEDEPSEHVRGPFEACPHPTCRFIREDPVAAALTEAEIVYEASHDRDLFQRQLREAEARLTTLRASHGRLIALARERATDNHEWYFDGSVTMLPPKDTGGHMQPFATCPHSDCVLVREAP